MLRCGGPELAQKVRVRDIGKSREEQKTEVWPSKLLFPCFHGNCDLLRWFALVLTTLFPGNRDLFLSPVFFGKLTSCVNLGLYSSFCICLCLCHCICWSLSLHRSPAFVGSHAPSSLSVQQLGLDGRHIADY